MEPKFIIYIFLLFLLFNKNPYFSLYVSYKQPLFSALINAFLFTMIFFIIHSYVQPLIESMIVFNEPNTNNDLVKSLQEDENENWVIVPPPIKETPIKPPPSFPSLPIQCAADFGNNVACCGQPPAIVPYENICTAKTPYCSGYVANEKWGTCQKEKPAIPEKPKLVSPPPEKPTTIPPDPKPVIDTDSKKFTCRPVSELLEGEEYNIIGRFGKYVLWNVHNKTSTYAQEKIKIDNAGYLLLPNESIPQMSATEFEGYNIETCIQNIAKNYKTNIMPQSQDTGPNVVFFPTEGSYSNTKDSDSIINVQNINLFTTFSNETELSGYNVFMVLIDPKN